MLELDSDLMGRHNHDVIEKYDLSIIEDKMKALYEDLSD